jgi:site-specific DNA-methyltransferase (adenine-specific)
MEFIEENLNKIICGDSIELCKQLGNECVDLTITSPPYDDLRKYNGFVWDFKGIADELYRITKYGGVVVWVVSDKTKNGSETGTSFRQALYFKEIGFNLHDTMIYASDKPPLSHNRYEQKFEYMFVFSKGKPKTFNPIMEDCKYAGEGKGARTFRHTGEELQETHTKKPVQDKKIKGNIWAYSTGFNKSTKDKIAFKHPAIFPEKLVEDHILSWSNEGDLILDCFMGSGTTAKMAILNNRNYIGFELSQEYVDIAEDRLNKLRELLQQPEGNR